MLTDGEREILKELEQDTYERLPRGTTGCGVCGELLVKLDADEHIVNIDGMDWVCYTHEGCTPEGLK